MTREFKKSYDLQNGDTQLAVAIKIEFNVNVNVLYIEDIGVDDPKQPCNLAGNNSKEIDISKFSKTSGQGLKVKIEANSDDEPKIQKAVFELHNGQHWPFPDHWYDDNA